MPKTSAQRKAHPRPTARPTTRCLLYEVEGSVCEESLAVDELEVIDTFWNSGKLRMIALLPGNGRCAHACLNACKSVRT